MEYKIYNCSLQMSKPPYELKEAEQDCNLFKFMWEDDQVKWRYIGSVPSLDIARYMVEHDKINFHDKNGNNYELMLEPSDELFCGFVKIEYNNNIEYYDIYHKTKNMVFKRRIA